MYDTGVQDVSDVAGISAVLNLASPNQEWEVSSPSSPEAESAPSCRYFKRVACRCGVWLFDAGLRTGERGPRARATSLLLENNTCQCLQIRRSRQLRPASHWSPPRVSPPQAGT